MNTPNPELRRIFEEDQADREGPMHPQIMARDAARLARVQQLLDEGAVRAAEDHLCAAFVFQHGDQLEHYWQAHELALAAVDLGHGPPARWLAAAAYDRWLMRQGLPQKFGTQYRGQGSRYVLYEVDPATTDEERARWDVPPLAEAIARAEELTRELSGQRSPDPANVLAVCAVPGLRVALLPVSGAEAVSAPDAMPTPEPLEPDEDHPLPDYLPPGLVVRRMGQGYCAVDAAGRFQATWIELPLPAGETLYMGWNSAEGPPPALEPIALAGRPGVFLGAAWSAVSAERLPMIVLRAGPEGCWLVSGRLTRAELTRVAAGLPVSP